MTKMEAYYRFCVLEKRIIEWEIAKDSSYETVFNGIPYTIDDINDFIKKIGTINNHAIKPHLTYDIMLLANQMYKETKL